MRVTASMLDKRVIVESLAEDTGFASAGSRKWTPIGRPIAAQVEDIRPSRGEALQEGMTATVRRARVRMRYRSDITNQMRLVMGARVMQIITVPAELGRRDGIEFLVEDYSPAGNPA
jgi:head-tail adaptor